MTDFIPPRGPAAPFGLLNELLLLREENARLRHDNEHLLSRLFDCTVALIRSTRARRACVIAKGEAHNNAKSLPNNAGEGEV